jgi:hypothetical protein
MSPENYLIFIRKRRSELQRIAWRTRREATLDDISQSAWLAAYDIEQDRGRAVDFLDLDDQELVLKRLDKEFVGRSDRAVRYATRLGEGDTDEEGGSFASAIARRLAAPSDSDPLVRLVIDEDEDRCRRMASESYSEAAAYLLLLLQFRGDTRGLASFLRVGLKTLQRQFGRCVALFLVQPSLFDGIETIDPDFDPRQGWAAAPRGPVGCPGVQEAWAF